MNHNEKIRNLTNDFYKNDIKRSLLIDERIESFQFEKKEKIIIATRKADNQIEKYILNIENGKSDGEFSVKIDNELTFLGICKNNILSGTQKLINKGKIIWEVEMENGKIKTKNILDKKEFQNLEIKKILVEKENER